MTQAKEPLRFVDRHGNPAKRLNPDSTWPWRRADGRTYAQVDPLGAIGRRKMFEAGELTLYEKVWELANA